MTKLACVFPGQGSQSVGMLKKLSVSAPIIQQTFVQASDILGYDAWSLCQEGPATELNKTEFTQPMLLAAGVAVWRVWQDVAPAHTPCVLAGHSLGEYTALVCAGALRFEDALPLVRLRGQFMQQAVAAGVGAMAAILNMEDAAVQQLCQAQAQEEVLAAVNFNAPGQVVIAGHASAVQRAIEACKAQGGRAIGLPVSVPSHCVLMTPAAERLAEALSQVAITSPTIPVINNVDVATPSDPDLIRDALKRQLYRPVQWTRVVKHAVAHYGVEQFYECGPGKVLSGLIKRICPEVPGIALEDSDLLKK